MVEAIECNAAANVITLGHARDIGAFDCAQDAECWWASLS
jgi:hypothetical protein